MLESLISRAFGVDWRNRPARVTLGSGDSRIQYLCQPYGKLMRPIRWLGDQLTTFYDVIPIWPLIMASFLFLFYNQQKCKVCRGNRRHSSTSRVAVALCYRKLSKCFARIFKVNCIPSAQVLNAAVKRPSRYTRGLATPDYLRRL